MKRLAFALLVVPALMAGAAAAHAAPPAPAPGPPPPPSLDLFSPSVQCQDTARAAAQVRSSHPGQHLTHHQIAVLMNAIDVEQAAELGDHLSPNTQAFDIRADEQDMDTCHVP
jgi:hypothetical protein